MIVEPLTKAPHATVVLPGSKSITNRALLIAGLADGTSTLAGVLEADDTRAMAGAVAALGAEIDWPAGSTTATVGGVGGRLPEGPVVVDAGQAGTVARFVLPVLAAGRGPARLDGDAQLRARPLGPLVDALRDLGAGVEDLGQGGHLPLSVHGPIDGGTVSVSGHVSSQFLSGLMMAAPLLSDGLTVKVTSPLVSRPYVTMTASVMASFGVECEVDVDEVTVPPGRYRACRYDVEPDASTASYFLAIGALVGGHLTVPGLGRQSLQGDLEFGAILGRMGAAVQIRDERTEVGGGGEAPSLTGIDVDMADCSDTVPTLAVVAAMAATPTRITGVGFIRAKESDRIGAVCDALRRCGVDAVEEPDGLTVTPDRSAIHGGVIDTRGDHRLAMAFTVLGLVVPGIELTDSDCVAKTFPGFFAAVDLLRQ